MIAPATWTRALAEFKREARAGGAVLDRDALAPQVSLWRALWISEVRAFADHREPVSVALARSYVGQGGSLRDLRAASNYVDLPSRITEGRP